MRTNSIVSAVICLVLVAPLSWASVIDTIVDTTLAGATVDATVTGGEYIGTVSGGGTSFGGPVGNGTLSVDSDLAGVYFGFSGMGDITGNSIRMYLDTDPTGGFNMLTAGAGLNDFADFGRERVSRPASADLTIPFDADYGWIITTAFSGFQSLYKLQAGGDNSLIYSGTGMSADPIGNSPSNGTYEFFIPYANLSLSAGAVIDFVVVYGNDADRFSAFLSNEGFPYQGSLGHLGNGPVTINDYHRLLTIPEPAAGLLLVIGGAFLARLRRARRVS